MRNMAILAVLSALVPLGGCNQPSSGSPSEPTQAPVAVAASEGESLPTFVGRIWVSVTAGDPRGSIRVFLPDKSMLMDSCFETFRVSEWGVISDTRIRWREDSIPIEAEYSQPTPDELILKPVGTGRQENYVAISVPYLCPDMPR